MARRDDVDVRGARCVTRAGAATSAAHLLRRRVRHRILARRPRPARSRSGRRTARAARARPVPSSAGSFSSRSCEPASSQAIESQTRTVIGGRRRLAFFHHVEVVIEGRHFVDLGHRHLHLGRERDEMRRRQAAVAILNQVQVLDQQIRRRGASPSSARTSSSAPGIDAAPFRRARLSAGSRLPFRLGCGVVARRAVADGGRRHAIAHCRKPGVTAHAIISLRTRACTLSSWAFRVERAGVAELESGGDARSAARRAWPSLPVARASSSPTTACTRRLSPT